MRSTVEIEGKTIGHGAPVYIVVELGVTHEQSVEVAESFVNASAAAGADCVKVESFQADELVVDRTVNHTYGTARGEVTENYYQLLKRLELSYSEFARIKAAADKRGITFFPTVATKSSIEFFESIGAVAYKLASPDLNNFPLQEWVAATGKPIFLDTGGAFIHEVEQALMHLERHGAQQVVIMHNPSGYPAPPDKTDLRMIRTMKDLFGIPVGLSCHTPGLDCVMAAIALGADVIEKPITRDTAIASPEHVFSFPVEQAGELVARIRTMEMALGSGRRMSVDEQSLPRQIGRRGLYAAHPLKKGQRLSAEDIVAAKPEKGISVAHIEQVLGRRLRRDMDRHTPITWDDF